MKILSYASFIVVMLSGSQLVQAQERAAAGSLENQMTWTSLSNMAKAAEAKADAVNSRVDAVVVCGKKGMVYAPDAPLADAAGCLTVMPAVPTCAAGQSLTFNGTAFSCVTAVALPTCGVGQAIGSNGSALSCLPAPAPLTAYNRGAKITKPLVQSGFTANTGSTSQIRKFPIPFKAGTFPTVVLNRNYIVGGDDSDNWACNITHIGFGVCGDADAWKGKGGIEDKNIDTVQGHKWIAVGEAQ